MFPDRYHNGSTRQLTVKQAATIRPAVANNATIKTLKRSVDLTIDLAIRLILEIKEFADVAQAEAGDGGKHPDKHRPGDIGAPLHHQRECRDALGQRSVAFAF